MVQPGVVGGMVRHAAHHIGTVIGTCGLTGDGERSAGHHAAEPTRAVVERRHGLGRFHFPFRAVGDDGAILLDVVAGVGGGVGAALVGVAHRRGPAEIVACRRATGFQHGWLHALDQRIGAHRLVVLQRHLAAHGDAAKIEIGQMAGIVAPADDVHRGVGDGLERCVLVGDDQRVSARRVLEKVEPALLLHQPRGEAQVRLVELDGILPCDARRRTGEVGQSRVGEDRRQDVAGRFLLIDPAIRGLVEEPQPRHQGQPIHLVIGDRGVAAHRTIIRDAADDAVEIAYRRAAILQDHAGGVVEQGVRVDDAVLADRDDVRTGTAG